MTEFTHARLAELKAVAEAANGSSNDRSVGYDDFGNLVVGKGMVLALIAALTQERREARAAKRSNNTYLRMEREAARQNLHRAQKAEAAIERVREAATEVVNQEDNHGRTHYNNCWTRHLHCLAAKIIHETGEDDE